jgi:hypothetical protein
MNKLTGVALDRAVANVLGVKSVYNCEKWEKWGEESKDDVSGWYKHPLEDQLKEKNNG